MTISIPYRGVIEIVGEHDVGKTLAALQAVDMNNKNPYKNTVFVDDDEKGEGTVKQLAATGITFKKYINIGEYKMKASPTGEVFSPDEMLDKVIYPIIDEILELSKDEKLDLVVFDTWRLIYQSCRGHVEYNQNKYRDRVIFRGTSAMIQGAISKLAREKEKIIIDKLKASCEILVITHHLKDRYQNNVKVEGSYVPESSRTMSEACNMRIWLRKNPISKVPIMLFLKRPNIPKLVDSKVKFIDIVPMKVVPQPGEESIWEAMKRYEENPIEFRKPTKDEVPNEEEEALIRGTLTTGQLSYVKEMARYASENQDAAEQLVESLVPQKVNDGIDGDVDSDFPEGLPKNFGQFYKMAMDRYGMNAADVQSLTDYGMNSVMQLNEKELGELWTAVEKLNSK